MKDAIRCLLWLGFLTLPATAAAAPPAYAMEPWSQPGICQAQHQRRLDAAAYADNVSTQVLMHRFLDVLDAVVGGDTTALKLAHLCDRLDVDLVPGVLPPSRPEPWNPAPPPPVGYVFTAYAEAAGTAFRQRIEATYTPEQAVLSLSTSSPEDAPVASGSELGFRYRDMRDACPLRLGQLADRLAAAGFSKEYYALEPPAPDAADSDFGVSASFRRDALAVGAVLQGPFVDQRAHPEAACVAEITLSLAK
ncbi:hypothetical protein [Xanthomonas sp. 3307]|uniref:hypothetical protein n=1 Tax=Xanthomonas sp. 3307 TaxID=3035316 RepID=UPI00161437A4|nr:hypothetical protein [Xanthomonas sp. 3307]MBB5942386.1 hypothetical protein [Xanthomonas sp. 3307]